MDGQQPADQKPEEQTWQFQPGQTVTPADNPSSAPTPVTLTTAATPAAAAPETASPQAYAAPAAEAYEAPTSPIEDPSTVYWQGDPANSISWTASEFIAHQKSAGWYALLNVGAVALAVIVWLVTRDFVPSLVIVFSGIVLSAYGARKPRQLQYHLDDHGLTIQDTFHGYQSFRSFSVYQDGPFVSIALTPLKRFSPLMTLYCDPQDEDRIIDLLSQYLPHEVRKPDAIDTLMRRIRF